MMDHWLRIAVLNWTAFIYKALYKEIKLNSMVLNKTQGGGRKSHNMCLLCTRGHCVSVTHSDHKRTPQTPGWRSSTCWDTLSTVWRSPVMPTTFFLARFIHHRGALCWMAGKKGLHEPSCLIEFHLRLTCVGGRIGLLSWTWRSSTGGLHSYWQCWEWSACYCLHTSNVSTQLMAFRFFCHWF